MSASAGESKPEETRRPDSAASEADPVLTEVEAAAYLKTTARKLRRLRSQGKIRFSRVGLTPTYRRSYLDQYLKQQEVRPTRRA